MDGDICDLCWTYYTSDRCPFCYSGSAASVPPSSTKLIARKCLPPNKFLTPGNTYTKICESFNGKYVIVICDTGEHRVFNRELFV